MKTHIKAIGDMPRPGHIWWPDQTLCGRERVPLKDASGNCKRCYAIADGLGITVADPLFCGAK